MNLMMHVAFFYVFNILQKCQFPYYIYHKVYHTTQFPAIANDFR